jgi:hypothetical protein
MLASFAVSAILSPDGSSVEDFVASGNITIEGAIQLLPKILVLEAERKFKQQQNELNENSTENKS